MNILRAIWFKEWIGFRKNILVSLGFCVTLILISLSQGNISPVYISTICGLAVSMMSLRFWEERQMGTLDSLLSLPASVRLIFLSKASFSAMVGVIAGLICLVTTAVVSIVMNGHLETSLLLGILTTVAITCGECNIVGYVMWSLSEQSAKIAQIAIFIVLGSSYASAFTPGVGVAIILIISAVIFIVGCACLPFLNAERIVLNLES